MIIQTNTVSQNYKTRKELVQNGMQRLLCEPAKMRVMRLLLLGGQETAVYGRGGNFASARKT
jgi:hypothetical protein